MEETKKQQENDQIKCPMMRYLLLLTELLSEVRAMRTSKLSSATRKTIYNFWLDWVSSFMDLKYGNYTEIPSEILEETIGYYAKRNPSVDWKEQIMQLGDICKRYLQQEKVSNKCIRAFLIAVSQKETLSKKEEELYNCLIYKNTPGDEIEEMSDFEELIYLLCLQGLKISSYKDPLIEWQNANSF